MQKVAQRPPDGRARLRHAGLRNIGSPKHERVRARRRVDNSLFTFGFIAHPRMMRNKEVLSRITKRAGSLKTHQAMHRFALTYISGGKSGAFTFLYGGS